MIVYTARAITESCDHYVFVYKNKPTNTQVITKVYETEMAEDLDWYFETTSVHIEETELIE